jgi:hypothetical protein
MSHSIKELKADKVHMEKEIARLLFNFEKKYQIQTRRITTIVANHSEVRGFMSVDSVEVEVKL